VWATVVNFTLYNSPARTTESTLSFVYFCLDFCVYREQILYEASQQPLMGHRPYVSTSYVEYPNVYDAMATAQRTPAYIAGTKV